MTESNTRYRTYLENCWTAPLFILVAVLGMYLPVVLAHPEFYLDDFYFLALLREGGIPHPFSGVMYEYHAALRPLFMLSLALDHALFGAHSIWYYATNLVIVWGGAVVLYHLLRQVYELFAERKTRLLPLLLALAFIVHADMFYGAVWISNRTESLMALLYLTTILATLQYFSTRRPAMLAAALLLFVLTMAAKAQAAHFPLLFVFLGWLLVRRKDTALTMRQVLVASIPFFLVSAAYAWVTVQYDPGLGVVPWQWLPQKFMAAIGILLISVFPPAAEPAYAYFVQHKLVAAGVMFAVAAGAQVMWRFLSPRDRWLAAGLLVLYVILLYPRIMHHAAPRVNSIQILYVLMVLGLLALRLRPAIATIVLTAFLSLHIIGTTAIAIPEWYVAADNDRYREVIAEERGTPRTYYQLVAWQHFDPYALYFFRHGDFGKDSTWIQSPARFDLFYGQTAGFQYDITVVQDSVVFEAHDPRAFFERDDTKTLLPGVTMKWQREDKPHRFMKVGFCFKNAPRDVIYLAERDYRYERVKIFPGEE